tara:strand:- start:14411 stop:14524 length:114 start_codon:yes stop_codon:yes gene_type:complete
MLLMPGFLWCPEWLPEEIEAARRFARQLLVRSSRLAV